MAEEDFRMGRTRGFLALSGVALALAGCASTSFMSTWKEPIEGPFNFRGKRVAAVVVSADESVRRPAEDALAREISKRGAQGTPSYTIMKGEPPKDEATAKKLLRDADIEGAVLMRVVSSEKETSYSPGTSWYGGPSYGSFYGYWGYGWGMAYDPGYLRTDTIVLVETLVYSVTQDKLLWAGRSRTTNPSNVPKFVKELATAAAKEMKKSGFISG
jgi:hypothetical protein